MGVVSHILLRRPQCFFLMSNTKEELLAKALLAERAERYPDMLEFTRQIIALNEGLSEEERNIFSVASKNTIGPKRSSCRCLAMLQDKHANDTIKLEAVKEILSRVVDEMSNICNSLVSDIEKFILTRELTHHEIVFYNKMCADYKRYLAEALAGEARTEAASQALAAYNKAYEAAIAHLKPADPIRLGLMLNFSVFNYEIQNDIKSAKDIAKAAVDGAFEKDAGDLDAHKDCDLIIQLLRDNLTLWQTEGLASSSEGEEESGNVERTEPVE